MPTVGTSEIRVDALAKVTGASRYIDDLGFAGQLHAKIVYASIPSGKIESIDKTEALRVEGVVDVITAEDVPGSNHCHIIFDDYPFFAEGEVKFIGQTVALVVAKTLEAADRGRDLVKVNYRPGKYSLSIKDSLKKGAPAIYGTDNIFKKYQVLKGDVDEAFKKADIVIENEYVTGYQEHAYIETQGVLALPGHDGSMTVYGSMQCPFYVHEAVARVMGIPENKVRIVQMVTGGGFGGKEDVPSLLAGAAAVAAAKTGKPIKLILTRKEDITSMSKRHPSWTKYRTAADRDGRILGIDVEYYLDAGAFSTLSPVVLWRGTVHALGPYRCENVRVKTFAVATNKVPCGAYRGFGTPQILFAHEAQMELLAKKTGKDPFELRKQNALRLGEETITGQKLNESFGLPGVMDQAFRKSGWAEKRPAWGFEKGEGDKRKGIGVSTILYGVGLGAGGKYIARAGAFVEVFKDGSVSIAVGTTEMGQGMRTVLSQICAQEMGVGLDQVFALETDTTRIPDSGPTVASRSTVVSGNAIIDACRMIKPRMAAVAARILDAKDSEIDFADGKVFVRRIPGKFLTFKDLAAACNAGKVHMAAQGWFEAPYTDFNEENGQGWAYFTYTYACNVAEVTVDIKTGEITVDRLTAAHDLGKAVNPMLVEGQIEGGSMQGMGYGVMEDILHNPAGQIITHGLNTYIIPTALDVPEIQPVIVEEPFPQGPFGAKGFGEQPLMGVAPAVASAVAHATGAVPDRIPMIPERVVEWIRKGNK
jgi:CO/xanthine dehydrogenase Mo-binding subunit